MDKLTNLELAEFCNQMGMVLHSGISALEGLSLLAEDAQSDKEKQMLTCMIEQVELTGFLYEAADSTGAFPNYAIHMMKLGEETGTLDDIMMSLAQHYTREANFASMLRSSITYPAVMLGMMILIILVLLTKVMPVFEQVFLQLGQELTGFSANLLQIGKIMSQYSVVFIGIIIAIVVFITLKGKQLPFQKKLQEMISICRFCEGMSISLKSGITTEESLSITLELVEDERFQQKIIDCKMYLEQGTSLAEALHKSNILNGTNARMSTLAQKTGTLDATLSQIAAEYEYALNSKVTSLIAMIEPTLVIILSVIVGTILFSVMLPLLGIMTTL